MHLLPDDDLIALNFYYRNKLKKSLTYLIFCGYFDKIRSLIESSAHFKKLNKNSRDTNSEDSNSILTYVNNHSANNSNYAYQPNNLNEINEKIDINETDEWWTDLPSSIIKKTFNSRPYRPTVTSSLLNNHSNRETSSSSTSSQQLRNSMNETILKDKTSIKTRGRTPLMLCSLIDDPAWSYSIAQNLIEKGANLALKDSNGFNALMYACLYERPHMLELFLNAPSEFCMLSMDTYGNTAFHLASLGKCQKNCSLLHQMSNKFGIDPFSQVGKNFFGHTPYDICKLNNHDICLRTIYKSENFRKGILSSSKAGHRLKKTPRLHQKVQIIDTNNKPRLERAQTELVISQDFTVTAPTPKIDRIKSASTIEINLNRSVLETTDAIEENCLNNHQQKNENLNKSDASLNSSVMQIDRATHKSSTETISNSVDCSESTNSDDYSENNNLPFRQARSYTSRSGYTNINNATSRSNNNHLAIKSLKCYNFIHSSKEHLIKIKPFCMQMMESMQKKTEEMYYNSNTTNSAISTGPLSIRPSSSVNSLGRSLESTRKKYRVTRFINQPIGIIESKITPINQERHRISHFDKNNWSTQYKMNRAGLDWQDNMNNIFETYQFEKSKSFRRTNTQKQLLFEEVSKTFIIGFQQVEQMQLLQNQFSRKNSVAHSSMSNRSGDRRQSVVGGKPTKKSRSQSIISTA